MEARLLILSVGRETPLLPGVSETISIVNCTFYNSVSGTDFGVIYHPDSFVSFNNMMIAHNGWNNDGTLFSGFDFSLPDGRDADAYLVSNIGTEDANPHFKINVINNVSTTGLLTAGTYYKAQWANSSVHQSKWNISNNKSTYLSSNSLTRLGHNGETSLRYSKPAVSVFNCDLYTRPEQK